MTRFLRPFALVLVGVLVLAACGGSASDESTSTTQAQVVDDQMSDDAMSDDAMSDMGDDEMSDMGDDEMSDMGDDEMSDDAMSDMGDDEMSDDAMSDMGDDEMSDGEMSDMNDLMSVIIAQGDLTVLDELVHAADLQGTLHDDGPFTVFAPTDAAFDAYFDSMGMTAEDLASDVDALTDLLGAHIVDGIDDAEMVMGMDGQSFTTRAGSRLDVSVDGDTVMVGGATVLDYDIAADNGVVHVIDTVLSTSG
jgi:uncharacterized surface protein with fasciclin (FAS1) repeats